MNKDEVSPGDSQSQATSENEIPPQESNQQETQIVSSSGVDSERTFYDRMDLQSKLDNDELMKEFRSRFDEPPIVVDLECDKNLNKSKCVNTFCESGEDLAACPPSVRNYYGQLNWKDQKVCRKCYENAVAFLKEMEDNYRAGLSIADMEFPKSAEMVIVDDDDEDVGGQNESLSARVMKAGGDTELAAKIIESKNTSLMFNYIIKSKPFREQINHQMLWLSVKQVTLEEKFRNTEKLLNEGQDDLHTWMRRLYKEYSTPSMSIEPLEIPYEEMRPAVTTPPEEDCVVMGQIVENIPASLPPEGKLERPELKVGDKVYFMRTTVYSEWVPAYIEEIVTKNHNQKTYTYYRLGLLSAKGTPIDRTNSKEVVTQLMAYYDPVPVRLTYGARVIAEHLSKHDKNPKKRFYAGMIAEPPSPLNKYRYLIFFDDGQVFYVQHAALRLCCAAKANIWEHFCHKMQPFIKHFVQSYPERAMLKVKKMDPVKLEYRGFWTHTRVLDIDCSIIFLLHLNSKITEWVYRGSHRLQRMWAGYTKSKLLSNRAFAARRTASGPMVHYENIVIDDDDDEMNKEGTNESEKPTQVRAVARKSTTRFDNNPVPVTRTFYERRAAAGVSVPTQGDGYISQMTIANGIKPRELKPHFCTPSCVNWIPTKEKDLRGKNPLIIPILLGFARTGGDKYNSNIVYIAPCGKILRTIAETLRYLNNVGLKLSIDSFDFYPQINIFNEYIVDPKRIVMKDLSFGEEKMPIPAVNTEGISIPLYMDYLVQRRPHPSVFLNLDPEFLIGCDCTDNCENKEKCACWQLTLSEGQTSGPSETYRRPEVGYKYKRLYNMVPTGIYECNSRCKCCVKTCLNRVVQHPLKIKLQLFKTKYKGWGTRCLNDIPAGTFVCVYVGTIYNEATANEEGEKTGDEYFAELDYIEVVEANKEGYEEHIDPDMPLNESSERNCNDDFRGFSSESQSRKRKQQGNIEDEDIRFPMDYSSSDSGSRRSDDEILELPRRYPSVRKYYGDDESVFIMDAKQAGNIGRYLNHSCDPNIFVQNVFVDTHDLRFPWVAFFASKNIKAGTELTWDYRYEVGSVPGKKLKCFCFSSNCRGRLL